MLTPAPPRRPPPRLELEPEAPLDLPADVLLIARWRDPRAWFARFEEWGKGDLSVELSLRAGVGRPHHPVDVSAPIELVVLLDRRSELPALRWALSFGLSGSVPSASSLASGPRDVDSPLGFSCAEARALGANALRMVCADSDVELAELLPVATRALPLVPLDDADLSLRLRTGALLASDEGRLRAAIASWLAGALGVPSVNARFDEQFAAVVAAISGELSDLARDLDGAVLGLSLLPHAEGIEVQAMLPRAPQHSALGRLVLGSGASGIAPTDFWYVHANSEDAGFVWAFEASALARWRQPLGELLATVLDFRGVPEQLQQQGRRLLEALPVPRGPVVHASGALPQSARRERPPWLERLGWQLYVVRGNFTEYRFFASELVDAFNDPILGPQFGRLLRAAIGPHAAPQRLRTRRPKRAAQLPRDSFTLEIELPAVRQRADGDRADDAESRREGDDAEENVVFVVVCPDEDGLKLAWGADERFLISLLADPAHIAASATLASRPGLGGLHHQRALAGGFFSLAALGDMLESIAGSRVSAGSGGALSRAPHGGQSPIVYGVSQTSGSSPVGLRAHVGRDTLEDLLFLVAEPTASGADGP